MKWLYSLRVRLLLMFMFVVMVTVTTIAFVQQATTASAFQSYTIGAKNIKQAREVRFRSWGEFGQVLAVMLEAYRLKNTKMLQIQVQQVTQNNHVRIILVDHEGRVVVDSSGLFPKNTLLGEDQKFTTALFSTANVPPVLIISTDADSSFTMPVAPPVDTSTSSLAQEFLSVVDRSLWLVVVLAWVLALLLTVAFSNAILKPVRELTRIANAMEQGDLSKRVKMRAKDELGKLAHAFNTMADSLAYSEQWRRNLVSDVAHELRTPLTNIRGYLEALKDCVIDPTPAIISSLYEESLLLSRLVVDLQELSLAEAGQLHMGCHSQALEEIIAQAVSSLQLQVSRKGLVLCVDIPPGLPNVLVDAERVGQILRNLMSNAIVHTPPGGEICVSVCSNNAEVRVSVRDTGEGIEEQHLPYIFERFYRTDASRSRATGGTGLGLAIARQMVEAHHGRMEVKSSLGDGSCFTFTLPVAVL